MTSEQLVIFTRYPEVGRVKTRLIPGIGAEAATDLHRQMAEHTLNQARQLRDHYISTLQITIRFAGDSAISDLQTWLGTDITHEPQAPGDLGDRLMASFNTALSQGATKIVTIGTDCPGITPDLLCQAFTALDHTDVVIGPALDGGYYLIGLSSQQPALFQSMDWGTSTVLAQTLKAIQRQGLTFTELAPLADVDRPEDLPIWQAAIARVSQEHHRAS